MSANFCSALGEFSGPEQERPFEVAFRWGRGLPVEEGARRLAFRADAGGVLRAAANHLRELHASGPAAVTGVIETMHNGEGPEARWRICVRGELRTAAGSSRRRKVWVHLPDEASYQQAGALHHARRSIQVTGELSSENGRIELVPAAPIETLDA